MIDQHFNFDLGTKEFGREHKFPFANNEIIVKQNPPYGFWSINFRRGQIPDMLRGDYTEFSEAEKVIKLYLAQRAAKEK